MSFMSKYFFLEIKWQTKSKMMETDQVKKKKVKMLLACIFKTQKYIFLC
jgi:hypothetical protein